MDLEYNVQILQVLHGNAHPRLKTPELHLALAALSDAGVLAPDETGQLLDAYAFLRHLINAMRMLRGSAQDLFLPPADSLEFAHLARRMGYRESGPLGPARQLRIDYETHTAVIRAFAERYFGRTSLPGPATGRWQTSSLPTACRRNSLARSSNGSDSRTLSVPTRTCGAWRARVIDGTRSPSSPSWPRMCFPRRRIRTWRSTTGSDTSTSGRVRSFTTTCSCRSPCGSKSC